MIPRLVLSDASLSPPAKLVYAALLLDTSDDECVAALKAAEVAGITGLSVHQVRRAMTELTRANFVIPIDRHNGHGGGFRLAVDRINTTQICVEGLRASAQGTTQICVEGLCEDAQSPTHQRVEGLSASAESTTQDCAGVAPAPYRNARNLDLRIEDKDNYKRRSSSGEGWEREDLERWIVKAIPNQMIWESKLGGLLASYDAAWIRHALEAGIAKLGNSSNGLLPFAAKCLQRWDAAAEEDKRQGRTPSRSPWIDYAPQRDRNTGPATIAIPPVVQAPVDEDESRWAPAPKRKGATHA